MRLGFRKIPYIHGARALLDARHSHVILATARLRPVTPAQAAISRFLLALAAVAALTATPLAAVIATAHGEESATPSQTSAEPNVPGVQPVNQADLDDRDGVNDMP